jgi:hypothetical protein
VKVLGAWQERHQDQQEHDTGRDSWEEGWLHRSLTKDWWQPNAKVHLQGNRIRARGEAPRNPQLPCQVQRPLEGC